MIRNRGGIVLLNPAPVTAVTSAMLDAATVVCPNEVEARAMTDADSGDPVELARRLRQPGRAVVVTVGAKGAAWAAAVRGAEPGLPTHAQVESLLHEAS